MRTGIKFFAAIVLITVVTQQNTIIAQVEPGASFPKPKNGSTYLIVHRGVHNGIPENSLPAYQKAIDLGCDFIEIDVRKTRDGRIVSVHNPSIDAYVKGATGKVSDFTLEELKAMDIGERVGPEWKNTRIPTIEEIMQLCRGQIGIYLDLKEPLVPELVEIIKKYKMEADIVWYIPAFFMDAIKEVKSSCNSCVPMPDPGPKENIAKVIEEVQPLVIATDMGELSKEYMQIAHENNTMVFVDEDQGNEAEWTKILDWGTDGIQTDKPQALIRFLSEREKKAQ
jgi:glycerophosphoryl diester phosphodiesterase